MFKNFFDNLFRLKVGERVSLKQLRLMEKILFFKALPLTWDIKGLELQVGLSRGGGGVMYRGVFEGNQVVAKFPSYQSVLDNNRAAIQEIDQEFQYGRLLKGIDGIPTYRTKQTFLINNKDSGPLELPYILIDHVNGVTLSTLLVHNKEIDLEFKLCIFKRLVQILLEVHAAGVVHKDINPENILIEHTAGEMQPENVWLIDFGASMHDRRFVLQYGSPEQHMPMAIGEVGVQSDIFSLALVIYTLLEHTLPFEEKNAVKAIVEEKELTLDFHFCENRGIQSILRKMLRKEPTERYPNMDAVQMDLMKISPHSLA